MNRLLSFCFLFGSSVLASGGIATAASFETKPLNNGGTLIFVEGELALGDEKTFANIAVAAESGVVVFKSNGGNLVAGISIGKAIRLKGFATYVPDGVNCASACAIAWLGGQPRLMSNTARVGFHAAYVETSDQKIATPAGNALIGAYLGQLGMADRAIVYITGTAPDSVQWLTFADAQRFGIEVKPFDINSPTQSKAVGASASSDRRDWSRYGEWIQIFSRPTRIEATQIGTDYKKRFDNTLVFRYANDWYAVVIGPFPPGEGVRRRDALVAANVLPSDSLITKGDKFVELAYGEAPPLASYQAQSTPLASRAVAFMTDFHQAWSRDNASALASLNAFYSDQVTYYGKPVPKFDVLREKRQFAERWPERTYSMRPGTVVADCSDSLGQCTVSGIVDWHTSSGARAAISDGSARYELRVQFSGSRTIVLGESGTVLSRNLSKR